MAELSRINLLAPVDILPSEKESAPGTVILSPSVIPPAPFIVRLPMLPENREAGSVIPLVFVNARVALALLASINPLVLVGALPAMVRVLPPTVKIPEVKAKVPATVTAEPRITPPAPFSVSLLTLPLKMLAGNVIDEVLVNATSALALEASITPEVRVGLLPDKVNVCAPTFNVPFVKASVPEIVALLPRVKVADVRSIERFCSLSVVPGVAWSK